MKKQVLFKISFFLGIVLIFISTILFLNKNTIWHYPAVIGVWLFFDFISFRFNKFSTLDTFLQDKKKFAVLFAGLFLLGFLIEFVGRIALNLWHYTDPLDSSLIGSLFYPFMLMSMKEMYSSLRNIFDKKIALTIFTMILGITIWEIPNVFSKDWI